MRILSYNQAEFIKDAHKMKLATDFFHNPVIRRAGIGFQIILCDSFIITNT
jgi:hypothetical protein